jgi:hypothetical protein
MLTADCLDAMANNSFFEGTSEIQDIHQLRISLEYSSFTSTDCPSLSSGVSNDSLTPNSSGAHRQPSVASSSSVSWEPGPSFSVSSLDSTGPSTPVKSGSHPPLDFIMAECNGLPMMGSFDTGICYPESDHTAAFDHNSSFPRWFDGTTGLDEHTSPTQSLQQDFQPFPYPADGRFDLCLSRPIFLDDNIEAVSHTAQREPRNSFDDRLWIGGTMDPSKAFLEPVTPPQPFNASPISPMTLDPYTPTPVQLKSSPGVLCSPLELKSHRRPIRSSKKTLKRAGSILSSLPAVIKATTKFRCTQPECKDKAFKRAEHLKRHMKCHSDKKPFICEMCGTAFSRSDNRRAHYDTHGNKAKTKSRRNAYYEECDPESTRFMYGKKAYASRARPGVRSKL